MAHNPAASAVSGPKLEWRAGVDRLIMFLENRVADDARRARTASDVVAVAARVRLLQLHRPGIFEVLATEDTDGSNYREVGFLDDGIYVGVCAPLLLCDHHDDRTAWPCADIRLLADNYGTSPEVIR